MSKKKVPINNTITYQSMTKLNFIEIENNADAVMHLIKNKNENILVATNPKDGVSFWNLKFLKFEYDLDYFWYRDHFCQIDENEIILGGGVCESIASNELIKYDINKKKNNYGINILIFCIKV